MPILPEAFGPQLSTYPARRKFARRIARSPPLLRMAQSCKYVAIA